LAGAQEGDPKPSRNWAFGIILPATTPPAVELLFVAVPERPGEPDYRARYARTLIEVHRYQGCSQVTWRSETYTESPIPPYLMPRAIAYWLSQQEEPPLRGFDSAMERQPLWNNVQVTNALDTVRWWPSPCSIGMPSGNAGAATQEKQVSEIEVHFQNISLRSC
jgi:hypothetical protein